MTDPILQVPPLQPIPRKTPEIVRSTPSYSETFVANLDDYFGAAISGTLAEARSLRASRRPTEARSGPASRAPMPM